ncbi:hypothetical protein H0A36_17365 [Endozoicomonas sp. SM1973]|uniref:Uncharacterized protein n=1 Tax=Spartinivicinus marinus TaxID=2994442 RepID=A0A853IF43_9GAMM|nr:hypothetical protein [Spartinivicinus marinus]MCX4030142.1 hypothetical protein [Spartinivicinus marinus]NYZ67785.1 hypothetical protein [Spartinivicinus marinus]
MSDPGRKDRLPYDEGAEAYHLRKHYNTNPYPKEDWKHEEWYLGWSQSEECDGDSWDWSTDDFKKD